jgi:hypothetical protein
MKFYFCETCGKRLTDAEIHDKQLKGVYCKECAQGVMTVQFDAITAPPTPATPSKPIREVAASKPASGGFHAPRSSRTTSKEVSKSEPRTRPAHQEADSKTPLYIGAAVLGVVLIGALVMFSGGETKSSAKADTKSEQNRSTNTEKPQPVSLPTPVASTPAPPPAPVKMENVAQSSTPAAPVPTQNTAQPPQDRSAAAFDTMFKALNKLEPEKKEERAALLEAFLKDFGDSDQAPRAHVMLDSLRKPPEPVAQPAPPAPAKQPDPPAVADQSTQSTQSAQGGRDLFNKKDLTGWTQKMGTCSVKDGEIVFPDKDKRIELDTTPPAKDYTLTMEVYVEDGSGAYFEVHTRTGSTSLDRSHVGQWITLQVTVKGASFDAKLLKGKGNPPAIEPRQDIDLLRISTTGSGVKHVRSVKAATAEASVAAATENVAPGRDLFNKKDLTGWTQNRGTCSVKDGEIIFTEKNVRLDTPAPAKDYVLTLEVFMEDGPGVYMEIHTRTGSTELNRSNVNQWLTLQLTVKGDTFDAKMLKGTGNPLKINPEQNGDLLRINAFGDGIRRVRSVRVSTGAEAVPEKQNLEAWRDLFDGKTMDGWQASMLGSKWSVVDGAITTQSFAPNGARVETAESFGDFEFTCEIQNSSRYTLFQIRDTGISFKLNGHDNTWDTVTVKASGSTVQCTLNGTPAPPSEDPEDNNGSLSGRIGFYTHKSAVLKIRSAKIRLIQHKN